MQIWNKAKKKTVKIAEIYQCVFKCVCGVCVVCECTCDVCEHRIGVCDDVCVLSV